MVCLKCHSTKLDVKNSRKHSFTVWRRRSCKDCGFTFTTNEVIDVTKLLKLQESARKKQLRPYRRGVLLKAISDALRAEADLDTSLFLLTTIEEKLLLEAAKSNFVITAARLHDTVFKTLEHYDSLAALNYRAKLKL